MAYEKEIEDNLRWGQNCQIPDEAAFFIAVAQVYATRALVDEQVIANQIAYDKWNESRIGGIH